VANSAVLKSNVVPLSFLLIAGKPRPQIEVVRVDSQGRWII
jgi:hypothetical protein